MGFPRDTSSEVPLDGCRDRASLEQGEIISGEGFLFTQMWVKEGKPLPVKRSSTVSVLHVYNTYGLDIALLFLEHIGTEAWQSLSLGLLHRA